jgi:hypothetical protein
MDISVNECSEKDIVEILYFNQTEDNKLPAAQQLNSSSVLPIERIIS